MQLLIDHNLTGEADLIAGALLATGWLELLSIQVVIFATVGLPDNIDDRSLWHFVQGQQMILLTENRNMKGKDSLEQTIRDESTAESLPVITVSSRRRLENRDYRQRCAERIVEIVIELERYRGASRIYIP